MLNPPHYFFKWVQSKKKNWRKMRTYLQVDIKRTDGGEQHALNSDAIVLSAPLLHIFIVPYSLCVGQVSVVSTCFKSSSSRGKTAERSFRLPMPTCPRPRNHHIFKTSECIWSKLDWAVSPQKKTKKPSWRFIQYLRLDFHVPLKLRFTNAIFMEMDSHIYLISFEELLLEYFSTSCFY